MKPIDRDFRLILTPDVRTATYWACRLSLDRMLFRQDQMRLPGISSDDANFVGEAFGCYLWTFTTADAVEPDELLKRWHRLANRIVKSGRRCLRVVERGTRGEKRWHLHAVTSVFWPVELLRHWATLAGFGRIHVKEIPILKAYYVLKYVTKDFGQERKFRAWSCVGFQGVIAGNVRCQIKFDACQLDRVGRGLCDRIDWICETLGTISFRLREPPVDPRSPIIMATIELKPQQLKEIVADALSGNPVFVGEYRGFGIREIKYTDKKSGQQVVRQTVEHNVEAAGIAKTIVEWLPVGTAPASVKPAANRGDIVKVTVTSAKRFGGATQYEGSIKPLTQLV